MNHLDFSIIQLVTMREAILAIIDEGRLLPDGSRAPWQFYPIGATDWHMDESGDCNDQRLDFCNMVQSYVMKEAQKANVEIIDHKARAF